MNAAQQVKSIAFAHALASVVTLVRQHFPEAAPRLTPWRDDLETRKWFESETWDMAFHFPGWSPRLQCRSLLMQLRVDTHNNEDSPYLLGVVLRGMTFDGERWRMATIGDWKPTGPHLPQPKELEQLHQICKDLFYVFSSCSNY